MASFTSNSRNESSRPKSRDESADLHIFIVPTELWADQQNLAFNQIINDTISIGFIRIDPNQTLSNMRSEIEYQLGNDYLPKYFLFCKSVGRCLALVRERQESYLQAKHFMPPNSSSPEIYLVDSCVFKDNHFTPIQKQLPSSREKTKVIDTPENEKDDNDEKMLKENLESVLNIKDSKFTTYRKLSNDSERSINKSNKDYVLNDVLVISKTNEFPIQEKENIEIDKTQNNFRKQEIDNLYKEIQRRYLELKELEEMHKRKLKEYEEDENKRTLEEEKRRNEFNETERIRKNEEELSVAKLKEELNNVENLLILKQNEIKQAQTDLEKEKANRKQQMYLKAQEIEALENSTVENVDKNDLEERILKLKKELSEMNLRQKEMEAELFKEKELAENEYLEAEKNFNEIKLKWENEKNNSEKELKERLQEEANLRALAEEKRKEHEIAMENERRKLKEQLEHFEKDKIMWEKQIKEYNENEKRVQEENKNAALDAEKNKEIISDIEVDIPEFSMNMGSAKKKKQLTDHLNQLQSEREFEEKLREESLKKIRLFQNKIQTKRNNWKELWKKKYFDEKKKTPVLEDQLTKYKKEVEDSYKKMFMLMENNLKENKLTIKDKGNLTPSNKANLLLQALRLQHEIENLNQEVEYSQMRLNAEKKLKEQTESELKLLKVESLQRKIMLSRTRSDKMEIESGSF